MRALLRAKFFQNPILGIYAGHLLAMQPNPDRDLLYEVYTNLSDLVGPHPDVEALLIAVDAPKAQELTYPEPPMLCASWSLVLRARTGQHDLRPERSYSARISASLWGSGAWLSWRTPPPLEAEAIQPSPELLRALVAEAKTGRLQARLEDLTKQNAEALSPAERLLASQLAAWERRLQLANELTADRDSTSVYRRILPWVRGFVDSELQKQTKEQKAVELNAEKLSESSGIPRSAVVEAVSTLGKKLSRPMTDLTVVDSLPNICGSEDVVEAAIADAAGRPMAFGESRVDFAQVRSAFAIALHMHQPLILRGRGDLRNAAIISNLQAMRESASDEQRYNARVFRWCYERMGEFVPQLVREGKQPRVMLDYSGTLLWGFEQMGLEDVLKKLRDVTCDPQYRGCVEWLGSAWGYPVAPSTPVQDYRLHVRAWQQHFKALFGAEALGRVRGFSPAEMALPNHPDVAYAFVKTLRDCGYRWVLVQEHTVEQPGSGLPPERKHLPHRLVCRNSSGEDAEIIAIVKTQGSDTTLVARMQPYYEARWLSRGTPQDLKGRAIPFLVTQIADGENGGVMMNDFPPKYMDVVRECSGTETPLVNVSEYLESLFKAGISEADLPALQPIRQARIWERFRAGEGGEKLADVIRQLEKEDSRFRMEGGSWKDNISWVKGYENILGPMQKLSSLFFEKALKPRVPANDPRFRNALFHLLISQTSDYRYWGPGAFVDYGREICRRGTEILTYDF